MNEVFTAARPEVVIHPAAMTNVARMAYRNCLHRNPAVTSRYGVVSIPTMNVYVNGEVVKTLVGAMPKPRLLRELEDYIAS